MLGIRRILIFYFILFYFVNPIYRANIYVTRTIGCVGYVRALVLSVTVLILAGTLADYGFGFGGWGACMGVTDIYSR